MLGMNFRYSVLPCWNNVDWKWSTAKSLRQVLNAKELNKMLQFSLSYCGGTELFPRQVHRQSWLTSYFRPVKQLLRK
jgi:hypothetical protein